MTHTSLDTPRPLWRARLHKAFAVVVAATLAIGAAGCGSSKDATTAPTNQSLAGEYLLETIQTKQLPVKIYDGPIGNPRNNDYYQSFVVTVKRGAIDVDDAGRYHMMIDYHLVADGDVRDGSMEAYGTYVMKGNRIALTRLDGVDAGSGTVQSGGVTVNMTIVDEGVSMPYVFRK